MSDEQNRLLGQLEQATARVPDESMDAEARQLCDAWRALGRILEACEGDWDAAGLVASLRRRERRRIAWRIGTSVAALALSLSVLAVSAWWGWHRAGWGRGQPAHPIASPTARPAHPHEPATVRQDQELAWDDSLDERFESIHKRIAYYDHHQRLDDLGFSVLDLQLERMGQEMNEL